ncbi:MAG TPA: glycosyltransferase family 4 protein [Pyrinomonadaceae bacterium]|nr:glycosyltransferase family 4 protein [Pyrinomonadaceae bacterium]
MGATLKSSGSEKSAKPRVFLAANFLSKSGGSRSVVEDLCEHLERDGYGLITASPYRSGALRGAHLLLTALRRQRDYDIAVVDLYSGRAFLIGEALSVLLSALRRPFILVLRGGELPEFASRHRERVRACLNRAAVVTAPSSYLLERMRPFHTDLRLLPNPVNLFDYEYELRRRPRPRLVWLRSFHEIYNPTMAPRVLAELKDEFPDISMIMVGRDKGDGSLERTRRVAAELGVEDRITFAGGVLKREVPRWIKRGDIFLNTTDVDNTPVSVLEALACGLCVVSTNVGGIPYLLEDERDALLVQPRDVQAMSRAVRRILTDSLLAERLSENARRKAQQFDWPLILPQWKSLLTAEAAKRTHGNGAQEKLA